MLCFTSDPTILWVDQSAKSKYIFKGACKNKTENRNFRIFESTNVVNGGGGNIPDPDPIFPPVNPDDIFPSPDSNKPVFPIHPSPSPAPVIPPRFSNPGFTDPGFTDPGFTDPGFTDPGFTDPDFSGPGFTDPGSSDPGFPF